MSIVASKRSYARLGMLAFVTVAMMAASGFALAADEDSGQTVECMLPGQIHTVAGHATMGARHPEQLPASDCRERGGEYTVDEHASQPMPVPHVPVPVAADDRIVSCLLPLQTRQLGEKARYSTARRTVRIAQSDCQARGGRVIVPSRTRHATHRK